MRSTRINPVTAAKPNHPPKVSLVVRHEPRRGVRPACCAVLCASVRAFSWLPRLWSAWRRQSRPTFACSRFPSVHQSFRHDKWEVGDRRMDPEVQQPLADNWRYRRQRQRLSRLRRGCVLNAVRLGSGGGDGGSSLVIGQAKSDRWSQAWASSNDSKRPRLLRNTNGVGRGTRWRR